MPRLYLLGIILFICGISIPFTAISNTRKSSHSKESYKQYIQENYTEQLTSPEKKKRKTFAQFGYGLSFFPFPFFPITDFIDPNDFGEHSYGKTSVKEKNGALYTCRGGFIDFSHLRVAVDWTVYLAFNIISEGKDMELPASDGKLNLHIKNIDRLALEDIAAMSQKIAYERLIWHELCSWYYHLPNYTFDERQSTFTPEDTYSNFLGTVIGRNIVLRILQKQEGLSYSQVATEEIQNQINTLLPVATKKQSVMAYDIVDANMQEKLPEAEQNKDVWWDSKVVFTDVRYIFKRYLTIGPKLTPWLVPKADKVGCKANVETLIVPQKTKSGASLYNYYTLTIIPDSALFFDRKSKEQLHKPFGTFISKNIYKIVEQVSQEMQQELLKGFSKRNKANPEKSYVKLKKLWFRARWIKAKP